jgi:UDP-glucose 4-epimerase
VLGWEPACPNLEDIIRSAWDWRLAHPEGYKEA